MNPYPRVFVTALAILAIGATCHPAAAQGGGSAPPQGVFGGTRRPEAPTQLDLTASLVEGYDSDVPAGLVSRFDRNTLQSGGFSTMLNASAAYMWRRSRTQLGANATSMLRHYAELGETRSVGHSAGIGLTSQLPARLTLLANQAASYSPTYFYGLFPTTTEIQPGDSAGTLGDFSVSDLDSYSHISTLTLRHDSGRQSGLSVSGDFRYTDRLQETEDWRDVSGYGARLSYSMSPTRNTGLNSAVRYRSGEFGYAGDGKTTEVGADVGWSYTRPLSPTRAFTLGFSLGVSGADVLQAPEGIELMRRRYRATGSGRFSYPLARTWRIGGDFRRGLDYVADLPTPVYSNGARASVDGLIGARVDVLALAGYSRGASALNRNTLQFDTYVGNVRVRYAINAKLATFVEYLYYYYDFRGQAQLLAGIPPGLERNGGRVGLTLWVPALRR